MARLVFAVGLVVTQAVEMRQSSHLHANPIRKVVTMLQSMSKKVEAEGEKEEALFEKFMCYCKTSGGDLEKSIAAAETKVEELAASVKESAATKAQLDADLKAHKEDREAAKKALAEAAAIREKEAAAFAAEKAEAGTNVEAIKKAVAALEKGMAGAFLQTGSANVLRKVVQSVDMDDDDRSQVIAFLQSSDEYSPQSGQITGILKQLGDEMAQGLAESEAAEADAIKNYEELTAAKSKEIKSLTKAIEEKSVRVGELAVSIAEMKNDAEDTAEALAEDKKFIADLKKNCGTKEAEWDEIKKTRAEEVLALADTIKILNDDDALELFKKTLPSPAASFMQVKVSSKAVRSQALAVIHSAQRAGRPQRQRLDFIALALHGKSVGFEKIITMIDDLVTLLKKEQVDDDSKKEECAVEFDKSDDKKKGLQQSIADIEAAMGDAEETIAGLADEIKGLEEGIKALDKSVAEATEQRKEENSAHKELMATNGAAKELMGFAKNRLNKFYNPKLYVAPAKRELSEEDRITVNMGGSLAPTPAPGGIAGTGVTVLAQVQAHAQLDDEAAPPPAPEAPGPFKKKTEESTGVIAMIDLLIKDLDKEMTVSEADEKNSQAEYEQTMSDAKEKKATDMKSLEDKESAKADATEALEGHKEDKSSTSKELGGVMETISALHTECDWLLQYYDARKEARAAEVDSLTNAKAVLNGADYSFVQTGTRHFLARN